MKYKKGDKVRILTNGQYYGAFASIVLPSFDEELEWITIDFDEGQDLNLGTLKGWQVQRKDIELYNPEPFEGELSFEI